MMIERPLRLIWLWSLIGFAFAIAPYLYFFAPAQDFHDRQGYLIGRDFVNVWFGAQQALAGKIDRIFTVKDYLADMRAALGKDYPIHNFSYPPHILPLILAFGLLTYFPSFALWVIAGTACFVAILRKNPLHPAGWFASALAALSPAAGFNFVFGQNGAFTAALLLGGLFFCETSPVFAGIMFGLLTVKPHLGILVPFVLLLRRNWKCIASAAVTAGVLAGATLLFWGLTPWRQYVSDTLPYQAGMVNMSGSIYNPMMPGPWSDIIRLMPHAPLAAMVIYGMFVLLALFLPLNSVRREGMTARSILLISLATMVILPYGFAYDMVAVMGALVIYLALTQHMRTIDWVVIGLLWALPGMMIDFKCFPVPLSSAILVAALGVIALRARLEERSGA